MHFQWSCCQYGSYAVISFFLWHALQWLSGQSSSLTSFTRLGRGTRRHSVCLYGATREREREKGQCWQGKGEEAKLGEKNAEPLVHQAISGSLTVSSVQMEWTWVPNITEVKMRKRRPSKHRKMRRMTVAGGEKVLHSRGWRVDEDKQGKEEGSGFMN